jgi:2-oxoglutarate/2-oxoacid ferredoxin oxidoreductase subunit beta
LNKLGSPVEMMLLSLKENSLSKNQAEKLSEEEKAGKIVRGVLCDLEKPEYTEMYNRIIESAQKPSSSLKKCPPQEAHDDSQTDP